MDPKLLILLGFSFIIFNNVTVIKKGGWRSQILCSKYLIIESIVLRVIITLILIYGFSTL